MPKFLICLLIVLSQVLSVSAGNVRVYRQIPAENVKASASSAISSSPAANVVNGKGMTAGGHVSNNLGEGMWVSEPSLMPVRYSSGTAEGAAWFLCEFTDVENVDQIRIWNHNQNELTRRGLRKVYID